MKILISIILLFVTTSTVSAQNITISGIAPAYVGFSIDAYEYKDYLSKVERLVATTTVNKDSTFTLRLDASTIKKVILKSRNNESFLFIQPNGNYSIYFPEKDKYDPYRPAGNNVEVAFFDLDSLDINYKILGFQRWVDNFMGNNYYKSTTKPQEFIESLDRFKTNVEKAYKSDTSNYFKTHVRFTIAGLDNIHHVAERNRFEKYDFYLKKSPVEYSNETYMEYTTAFYQKMLPRLSTEANQAVYEGVLKSSPTLIMKALGREYTLSNLHLRELVMIQSLAEEYISGQFPETNILTILDSLSQRSLFKEHQEIAKNLKARITTLNAGGRAPDFVLMEDGKPTKTLFNYEKRHIYVHFFDPESEQTTKEIPLIEQLKEMYGKYIQFISVYKKADLSEEGEKRIKSISWDVYGLPGSNAIWKNYSVETFPNYTLIDAVGYIVASPALAPTPNGQYETIDKTFFYLKKAWEKEHGEEEGDHRN
jgi:hypothetical protein